MLLEFLLFYLLLFIIFVFFRYGIHYNVFDMYHFSENLYCSPQNFVHKISSGDLILTANKDSNISNLYLNDPFNHGAIVIKDSGSLITLNISKKSLFTRKLNIVDLSQTISKKHVYFGVIIKTNCLASNQDIFNFFVSVQNKCKYYNSLPFLLGPQNGFYNCIDIINEFLEKFSISQKINNFLEILNCDMFQKYTFFPEEF